MADMNQNLPRTPGVVEPDGEGMQEPANVIVSCLLFPKGPCRYVVDIVCSI